ncbi:MAG: hypothetical protein EOP84_34310, partial [Verrucomicrobiaceae bacterium]
NYNSAGTSNNGLVIGDFSGLGTPEILLLGQGSGSGTNTIVTRSDSTPADTLIAVTNGSNARWDVAYRPMTDSAIYVRESGAVYPLVDLISPHWLVSSLSYSSGTGATNSETFRYAGNKVHVGGRGPLGFHIFERTAPGGDGTPITTWTTMSQSYPFVGLPTEVRRFVQSQGDQSWLRLSTSIYEDMMATTTCWATVPQTSPKTPALFMPVLTRNSEQSRDLNQAPLTTITTTNSNFTCAADPGQVAVVTTPSAEPTQVFSKTTVNQYLAPNISGDNWIIGKLSRATQTNSVPAKLGLTNLGGTLTASRSSAFEYSTTTGQLSAEVIEPDNPAICVRTSYGRDSFGNRSSKTVANCSGATGDAVFA